MQKVWKQIGLQNALWMKLEAFMQDNYQTTYGDGIKELLVQNERFKAIMKALEKKAQESEEWKNRAEAHIKGGKTA